MRTHLSFAARDLAKSQAFYATLLNAEPQKSLDDYVLFALDDPAIELALNVSHHASVATDAHFGIAVESAAEVEAAIGRLQASNLVDRIEREETCCYANQTKVWTHDPDGRRWEIYTVHHETEETSRSTSCC